MNKRKLVRNVSLVALSAVMLCGSAAALAGCGHDTTYELTVNIFCNDTDAATNRKICETWAEDYTKQLREAKQLSEDQAVTVKFSYNADTTRYFDALDRAFSSTTGAADIIYLSPKYVKAWVQQGRVMDISEFISPDDQDAIDRVNGIWSASLGLYGYRKGETDYKMGQSVKYLKAGEAFTEGGKTATEPGFYNANMDKKVELYGLPKDYSNFTLGFNAKFFTNDIRNELMTKKATQERNVKGARGNTSKLTFKGGAAENDVITYAVSVDDWVNPLDPDAEPIDIVEGEPANIINIGVPVRYKPYNFYRFANYNDAIQGGDPVALSVEAYSEDGAGYIVTLPGFPGDTFELPEGTKTDPNAIYDNEIGHITYTYQEFGAFTWAICYYYNTFNWNCKDAKGDVTGTWTPEGTLSGMGGIKLESGTMSNVYGNGQYEGSPNPTLYLLPWLYANHADFINQSSTRAISGETGNATAVSGLDTIAKMRAEYAAQSTAAKAEKREKMHLDGSVVMEDYWYGPNTDNFIEAYGAFLEYASTWNGLDGNCGDEDSAKSDNGWTYFRGGAEIFYGAGTWDSATRNESDYADGYAGHCDFHLMPQAVSEKYALYSSVRDGYYEGQVYYDSDDDGLAEKHAANGSEEFPAGAYSLEDIYKNQTLRQDQWGARMDSVGFAANASLLETKGTDAEWKIAGAASLIMALSVDETAQVTLTYSGAQIPNFTKQCEDFLNYQPTKVVGGKVVENKDYDEKNNTFVKMITPEGRVDVTEAVEAKNLWNAYYQIVCALDEGARDIGNQKGNTGKTVNEFLSTLDLFKKGAGKVAWKDKDGKEKTEDIVHDPQYDNVKLGDFTGEISKRAYAMKILYMTTFNYSDRDINIRMQYGLNSARDSATYTYNTNWINLISMRDGSNMAYNFAKPVMQGDNKTPGGPSDLRRLVQTLASGGVTTYQTPAAFCLNVAQSVQDALAEAIALEQRAINKGK